MHHGTDDLVLVGHLDPFIFGAPNLVRFANMVERTLYPLTAQPLQAIAMIDARPSAVGINRLTLVRGLSAQTGFPTAGFRCSEIYR